MIKEVCEFKDVIIYLKDRELLKQYKKAKEFILNWNTKNVSLKYREPRILWIIYFRINKQFRAFGRIDWEKLIVFKIDNHK